MPDWLLPCLLLLLGLPAAGLLPLPASLLLAGVPAPLAAAELRCASASKPAAAAAAAAVAPGVLHTPAPAADLAAGVEMRDAGLDELQQLLSFCLQVTAAANANCCHRAAGEVAAVYMLNCF